MATREITIEYLTTTKIGEKGQLTVPKQFREDLQLEIGSPFAVLRIGSGLILLPDQHRFDQLCGRVSAALLASGAKPEDLLATLPEARDRIYARRYGRKASIRSARRPSSRNHRGK